MPSKNYNHYMYYICDIKESDKQVRPVFRTTGGTVELATNIDKFGAFRVAGFANKGVPIWDGRLEMDAYRTKRQWLGVPSCALAEFLSRVYTTKK